MSNLRKMIPRVESIIKHIDAKAIVSGTFYDDVSDRLILTVVKGSRRLEITLLPYEIDGVKDERIHQTLKRHLDRLAHTPTG